MKKQNVNVIFFSIVLLAAISFLTTKQLLVTTQAKHASSLSRAMKLEIRQLVEKIVKNHFYPQNIAEYDPRIKKGKQIIEFDTLAKFVSKLDTYRPGPGEAFAPKPKSSFYKLVDERPITFLELFKQHIQKIDAKVAEFLGHVEILESDKMERLARIILMPLLIAIDDHLMPVVGTFTKVEIKRDPTQTGMGEPVTLSKERIEKLYNIITKILKEHFYPQDIDRYNKRKTEGKTILSLKTLNDFTSKLKSIRPAPGQTFSPRQGTKYHKLINGKPITFLKLFNQHVEQIKEKLAELLRYVDNVEPEKQEILAQKILDPLLFEIDAHW